MFMYHLYNLYKEISYKIEIEIIFDTMCTVHVHSSPAGLIVILKN